MESEECENGLWHGMVHKYTPEEVDSLNFKLALSNTLGGIQEFLEGKNEKYGNAALDPEGDFVDLDTITEMGLDPILLGILYRLDEKMARVRNNPKIGDIRKNDVVDLIGGLLLICIHKGWDDFSSEAE